jgi:hypothetical protein
VATIFTEAGWLLSASFLFLILTLFLIHLFVIIHAADSFAASLMMHVYGHSHSLAAKRAQSGICRSDSSVRKQDSMQAIFSNLFGEDNSSFYFSTAFLCDFIWNLDATSCYVKLKSLLCCDIMLIHTNIRNNIYLCRCLRCLLSCKLVVCFCPCLGIAIISCTLETNSIKANQHYIHYSNSWEAGLAKALLKLCWSSGGAQVTSICMPFLEQWSRIQLVVAGGTLPPGMSAQKAPDIIQMLWSCSCHFPSCSESSCSLVAILE